MKRIFVVAEHRRGEIREITGEMLSKGKELAEKTGAELAVLLLGNDVKGFAEKLTKSANKVYLVEDERLVNFNSEDYQKVIAHVINEQKPDLVLIGHTSFGMDLAPSLAVELDVALASDCIDIELEGEKLLAIRQVYGGKVNARVTFSRPFPYIITIRSGSFAVEEYDLSGEVVQIDSPLAEDMKYKKFIEYIEAAAGDVDITQADIVIGVGRGIGDGEKNLPLVENLAKALGGVLACSRPIIDKKWLPKERQVGTSGKTVKPKIYIAVGISGTFQHIAGMKGSATIIAINKDPKAPIFNVADYGIVDDLFKVLPALQEKIKGIAVS